MICRRCLLKSSRLPLRPSLYTHRFLGTSQPAQSPPAPAATSTSSAQPFSTPLNHTPNEISLRPKPKSAAPTIVSSCPAGTVLRGINYIKGRDDPVALAESEYPEWLWRVLDVKKVDEEADAVEGDEFSKSKKLRRKAAKRQRQLEAQMLDSGNTEALMPKVPLTQQSIDLPGNEEGTVEGALGAQGKRDELRKAMRKERKAGIKQKNYLKSM